MLRRIVGARVGSHPSADDLVQEALVRVLAARERIEPGMLEPYAIATVRNLVATLWRSKDRDERNLHRALDPTVPDQADDSVVVDEQRSAMARAIAALDPADRAALVAHDVEGLGTRSLADASGSTTGAVAARLKRTRAKLRVEYLLALNGTDLPTAHCRPVLLAISAADRRRQRELDASGHLLACAVCSDLSEPLQARGPTRDDEVRVAITADPDIVAARKAARELAAAVGGAGTDLTLVATAVSEVARNIVRFAGSGEVTITVLHVPRPGIRVEARDAGPGIPDVEEALTDGYSTYDGLGLGLPGARRLMDEFAIETGPGRGTAVTMTKWFDRKERR